MKSCFMIFAFSPYSFTSATKLNFPSFAALNIAANAYCPECEVPDIIE